MIFFFFLEDQSRRKSFWSVAREERSRVWAGSERMKEREGGRDEAQLKERERESVAASKGLGASGERRNHADNFGRTRWYSSRIPGIQFALPDALIYRDRFEGFI